MNELISNKKTAILLMVALVAALLAAIYFYLVSPLLEERSLRETSLSSVQSEVALLEAQIAEVTSADQEEKEVSELLDMLPSNRDTENVLLFIEKAEAQSSTTVQSIIFQDSDALEVDAEMVADTTNVEGEAMSSEESVDGISDSSIVASTLPPNLRQITFNINLLSTNYNSLNSFVDSLQSMERVMKINSITSSSQEDGVLSDIQVTTFFYPGE